MWVSWMVARRVVLGLMLVALAFVGLEVTLLLLAALFLDSAQGMDARAQLVRQLLRILVLAFAVWVAIEAPDVGGPGPEVPVTYSTSRPSTS